MTGLGAEPATHEELTEARRLIEEEMDRQQIPASQFVFFATSERVRTTVADSRRRTREWRGTFGAAWINIGRPFSTCVYCEAFKLGHFPGEKFELKAHCIRERFVLDVVYSFPSLRRDVPGLTPWDAVKWARWWKTSGARTSGSHHAVAFCLSLWSGSNREWQRRGWAFDVVAAFGSWDDSHRAAFLKWCAKPWRP